jgi:holliday junction DNA helicase RuvA
MIAKLSGLVDQTGEGSLVIDVGGVGYLVFCSARTLAQLPPHGKPASLLIETQVSQDHIHLYGFADAAERSWFRLLNTVQGVGAKVALAILSVLDPGQLVVAIAAHDKAALARAQGVGPKLAGRILSELKDKAGGVVLGPAALAGAAALGAALEGAAADAVSALVNLGYRRTDAFGVVVEVQRRLGQQAGFDALVKAGLRELSQ